MGSNLEFKMKYSGIVVLAGLLLFGSTFSILTNVILSFPFPWKYKLSLPFEKPGFEVFIFYIGKLLMIIPVYLIKRKNEKKAFEWSDLEHFRQCFKPTFFDILSTYLQNYALLSMPTTVWQMFHGFQILFTTVVAVTMRHQQLFLSDWLGLFLTVAGICVTGSVSLVRGIAADNYNISSMFFSIILVFFSHGLKSFQVILEEQLTHDVGLFPSEVIAFEGIWGTSIVGLVLLPLFNILHPGTLFYENFPEVFTMFTYSNMLIIYLVLYIINSAAHQYFSLAMISISSAIHRILYEMIQIPIVWLLSTVLYYTTNMDEIGEKLDSYSFSELIGFGIAVCGTLIYNHVIKFPCFTYLHQKTSKISK